MRLIMLTSGESRGGAVDRAHPSLGRGVLSGTSRDHLQGCQFHADSAAPGRQ